VSQLQNNYSFGRDHTLPNVDVDVLVVMGVMGVVVRVVELWTTKLLLHR
jgi:hypothetical protein